MKTPIDNINFHYSSSPSLRDFEKDPADWFVKQPPVGNPSYLLAYADDGVIFGLVNDSQLTQAFDVFGNPFPKLNDQTLQYARLFGNLGEIRVFRRHNGFASVRIEDDIDPNSEAFTRSYILWGDSLKSSKMGWSWVEDGQLGIHQAIPLAFTKEKSRSFRLLVRFYINYEINHGQARIVESRLLDIQKA